MTVAPYQSSQLHLITLIKRSQNEPWNTSVSTVQPSHPNGSPFDWASPRPHELAACGMWIHMSYMFWEFCVSMRECSGKVECIDSWSLGVCYFLIFTMLMNVWFCVCVCVSVLLLVSLTCCVIHTNSLPFFLRILKAHSFPYISHLPFDQTKRQHWWTNSFVRMDRTALTW